MSADSTTLRKHEALHSAKTNSQNVLFHLLLLSNAYRKCVFKKTSFSVASLIFFCRVVVHGVSPFALHFLRYFELGHGQKMTKQPKKNAALTR